MACIFSFLIDHLIFLSIPESIKVLKYKSYLQNCLFYSDSFYFVQFSALLLGVYVYNWYIFFWTESFITIRCHLFSLITNFFSKSTCLILEQAFQQSFGYCFMVYLFHLCTFNLLVSWNLKYVSHRKQQFHHVLLSFFLILMAKI